MVTSQSGRWPLCRLVLFIICLAVAGSIVAGISIFAMDLQQQKTPAPANFGSGDDPDRCQQTCAQKHCIAFVIGQPPCDDAYASCLAWCK